ncbi:MAG: GNAT family N-acetyltransferase [Chroococcales cyanobacterium]
MPQCSPGIMSENCSEIRIRSATVDDVAVIFELICALAAYENLSDAVTGSPQALEEHLFGDRPYAQALIAEWSGTVVGFALFFYNYSTFLTKPGLYLEDLFVLPEYRGRGIGKSLIEELAKLAVERGCGRMEWSVLDWNEPAIAFYRRLGAEILPDWRICRLSGEALVNRGGGS